MTNIFIDQFLLQFGFSTKEEKKELLREYSDKLVLMDLTCFDPQEFYAEFPNLVGSFAALFAREKSFDEKKPCEVHFRDHPLFTKDLRKKVYQQFEDLDFSLVEISFTTCGFIFPRTIVQIINEAYFALEEGVATKEDINRAMKFGVNYPCGPFEWAEGKEVYVVTLLNELFQKTGDLRYRPCSLLES